MGLLTVAGVDHVDTGGQVEAVLRRVHGELTHLRTVQAEYLDLLHRPEGGDDHLSASCGVDRDRVLQLRS